MCRHRNRFGKYEQDHHRRSTVAPSRFCWRERRTRHALCPDQPWQKNGPCISRGNFFFSPPAPPHIKAQKKQLLSSRHFSNSNSGFAAGETNARLHTRMHPQLCSSLQAHAPHCPSREPATVRQQSRCRACIVPHPTQCYGHAQCSVPNPRRPPICTGSPTSPSWRNT